MEIYTECIKTYDNVNKLLKTHISAKVSNKNHYCNNTVKHFLVFTIFKFLSTQFKNKIEKILPTSKQKVHRSQCMYFYQIHNVQFSFQLYSMLW